MEGPLYVRNGEGCAMRLIGRFLADESNLKSLKPPKDLLGCSADGNGNDESIVCKDALEVDGNGMEELVVAVRKEGLGKEGTMGLE